MNCPECGSTNLILEEFDFGVCRETGYHDAGELFRCRECGAKGDVSDAIVDTGEARGGHHGHTGVSAEVRAQV